MRLLAPLPFVVLVACAAGGREPRRLSAQGGVVGPSETSEVDAAVAGAQDAPGVAQPLSVTAIPAVSVMPDVDYWATPQPVVDKMLEVARVTASDLIYDLGCGDARSLVTAALRFGARGVGFDIDPRRVMQARENARTHAVDHLVSIEQADIFSVDLSPADVIFLYITPRFNLRLVPQFEKMRRGSRIVSHEFEIPGAKPTRIVRLRGPHDGPPGAAQPAPTMVHTIYLWKLPWQRQWTDWNTSGN